MKAVVERVDWEYQNYYNQLACTSKANIYGKSSEIERRKRIIIYLRTVLGRVSEDKEYKLLREENILEAVDRIVMEHPEKTIERTADDYIAGVLGEENSPNKMHL